MEKPEQQLDRGLLDRLLALALIQPGALRAQPTGLLDHRQRPQHKLTRKHDDHLVLIRCKRLPPARLHLAVRKHSQSCIDLVQPSLHAPYSAPSA